MKAKTLAGVLAFASLLMCARISRADNATLFRVFLKDGGTPTGSVSGSMRRVIRNTSQLSDADRKAMAVYLESLPPVEGPGPPAKR